MHKHTLTVGTLSGLFFLGGVAAFVGSLIIVHSMDTKLDEQKYAIARYDAHAAELKSLSRLVEESAAERQEIMSFILSDNAVIDFLALVKTIGDEQGLSFETKALEVIPGSGNYEELTVDIIVSGTYGAVMHSLRLLEALPYQSYIANASLVRGAEGSDAWTGTFTVRVTKTKKI